MECSSEGRKGSPGGEATAKKGGGGGRSGCAAASGKEGASSSEDGDEGVVALPSIVGASAASERLAVE